MQLVKNKPPSLKVVCKHSVVNTTIEAHSESEINVHLFGTKICSVGTAMQVSSRWPAMAFYDAKDSLRGFQGTTQMLNL